MIKNNQCRWNQLAKNCDKAPIFDLFAYSTQSGHNSYSGVKIVRTMSFFTHGHNSYSGAFCAFS